MFPVDFTCNWSTNIYSAATKGIKSLSASVLLFISFVYSFTGATNGSLHEGYFTPTVTKE